MIAYKSLSVIFLGVSFILYDYLFSKEEEIKKEKHTEYNILDSQFNLL